MCGVCCCSLRKQQRWKEKLFLSLLVLSSAPSDVGHLAIPRIPGEQSPFISNKGDVPCMVQQFVLAITFDLENIS